MYCQACGNENSDDARFCGNCGRETRAQAAAGGGYASSGMREPRPHVPNHLVWAIFVSFFWCAPAGIVAMFYTEQVNRRLDAGDYEGAKRASDSARTWVIVSGVLGLIIWAWVIMIIWASIIFP